MDLATLQNSVFLHALGSAILNSLWQGFILWFIYETINIFYKAATSGFKNKLSTILIFIAFGWFITSFISGIVVDENILPAISSSTNNNIITQPIDVKAFSFEYLFSFATVVLPYLSVSYIFLLIFLMAKLISAYRHVFFIANKRLIAPPLALQNFASKVATQMMIIKKITVWISDYIDVPATIGFIKPVILIPVASINNLSSQQLEAIILHELSHIKRNDYLVNLFISVIETILFFNPFILLLSKIIKRERENCCDDFVIQYRYDPHSYASALLRLEQSRKSNLELAIGAVSGKKQLLTRIQRITNNEAASKQFNYGQKLLALIIVTGIICSVAWLSPQKKVIPGNKMVTKTLEKHGSILSPTHGKKTALIDMRNVAGSPNLSKAGEKQRPSAATFNNVISNLKLPEGDNKIVNPEWDDFEKFNQKLVDEKVFQNPKLFSLNKIKISPFMPRLNFTFPNPGLNSDVTELNKGLVMAYKEINKLDWNKIECNINESLSKININQILKLEREELLNNKPKRSEAFKRLKTQQHNAEQSRRNAEEYMFLNDSQNTSADLADEVSSKAQTWTDGESKKINYGSGSNSYVYVPKANSAAKAATAGKQRNQKAIMVTGLDKNIKVVIEHLTQALDKRTSFNFTSPPSPGRKLIP